jgi:hypothetical protein
VIVAAAPLHSSLWVMAEPDMIRTPDQRVRVFVSSVLGELAAERQAVRDAVTTLRLVPVMFELGARPHPPRPVYRSYLAQSQVFVGIYWQSYGWVAPGERVSGLEDEYELPAGLPRLIYVKEPAPDRMPRLTELLARIRDGPGRRRNQRRLLSRGPGGHRRTAGQPAACRTPDRCRPLDPGRQGKRLAARLRAARPARRCGPGRIALPDGRRGIPGGPGVGPVRREQTRGRVRTPAAMTRRGRVRPPGGRLAKIRDSLPTMVW